MKSLFKGIFLILIGLTSIELSAQTSGCLVIEDAGTGEPARTRLSTGMDGSTVSTTCFGFGSTKFTLRKYTGSPLSNSKKCDWSGTFTGNPTCLFVNPIGGGWVCGRVGNYNLVSCPIDDYIPLMVLGFGFFGFIFISRHRVI